MKAPDFRAAIGYERSRLVAADCGYTNDSWRQACANGFNIEASRLACMLNALEALNKSEAAFIRAARKEINSRGTGEE